MGKRIKLGESGSFSKLHDGYAIINAEDAINLDDVLLNC